MNESSWHGTWLSTGTTLPFIINSHIKYMYLYTRNKIHIWYEQSNNTTSNTHCIDNSRTTGWITDQRRLYRDI